MSRAARECDRPASRWIFCDDFEVDRSDRYFEIDSAAGRFSRISRTGEGGSYGMRAHWNRGMISAGALHLAFGRTPTPQVRPMDGGTSKYRHIFWRLYVRNQTNWTGGGADKLTRAQILASPKWAQAMVALVWSGGQRSNRDRLLIEPVSGTDASGRLLATKYNDPSNRRWLGSKTGRTAVFADSASGRWHCIEAEVRLNEPGRSNGVFRLWVDDKLDAEAIGLNWVGGFEDYGINAIFIENYWNRGAPATLERYFDRVVVSADRIGCSGSS